MDSLKLPGTTAYWRAKIPPVRCHLNFNAGQLEFDEDIMGETDDRHRPVLAYRSKPHQHAHDHKEAAAILRRTVRITRVSSSPPTRPGQ